MSDHSNGGDEAQVRGRGYRQSRRSSKSAKKARKAEKRTETVERVTRPLAAFGRMLGVALMSLVALAIVFFLVAMAVNGIARWSAKREAGTDAAQARRDRQAKENLLIVGVENERAVGFLAVRMDRQRKQVFGVAIPDGAFIEVPGQGFERIGDSYVTGASVSAAAVSNYLGVPFRSWVVVPANVYRDALKLQSMVGVGEATTNTNLKDDDLVALSRELAAVPQKDVALVPLPVKPIKLGDQTYFEPQREEVADLLKSWWGIDINDTEQVTRVIVYNGSGIPGIAGEAAQRLIRAGFRVIDTKNADRFDYATTQIIVQRGPQSKAKEAAKVLGVGTVVPDPANQDVADLIVIVGKDYKPQGSGGQGGTNP